MKNTLIKSTCALGRFPTGDVPKNHASVPEYRTSASVGMTGHKPGDLRQRGAYRKQGVYYGRIQLIYFISKTSKINYYGTE